MTTTTTRRALLKAAPTTALVMALPASATATADRAEWSTAMDRYARVKTEDAAFTPGWLKAWRDCKEECDAIPHVSFKAEAYKGGRCQTTANTFEVAQARREVALLNEGKMRLDPLPGLREHYEIKRKLVEADDARKTQIQAVRERYDMDALDDKAEILGDQLAEARDCLMQTPAPDLAALHWKLLQLRDQDGDMDAWVAKYVNQTYADIARLMPEAA